MSVSVSYTHLDVYKRQEVLLLRLMFFLIILSKCLAILWEGAYVLFINGLMGILGLCIFGNAFSIGGLGFICFRYLVRCV